MLGSWPCQLIKFQQLGTLGKESSYSVILTLSLLRTYWPLCFQRLCSQALQLLASWQTHHHAHPSEHFPNSNPSIQSQYPVTLPKHLSLHFAAILLRPVRPLTVPSDHSLKRPFWWPCTVLLATVKTSEDGTAWVGPAPFPEISLEHQT